MSWMPLLIVGLLDTAPIQMPGPYPQGYSTQEFRGRGHSEAMLAAIERLNRFRRLVIHTIHTCEVDTYCAPFLKRITACQGAGTSRPSFPRGV